MRTTKTAQLFEPKILFNRRRGCSGGVKVFNFLMSRYRGYLDARRIVCKNWPIFLRSLSYACCREGLLGNISPSRVRYFYGM